MVAGIAFVSPFVLTGSTLFKSCLSPKLKPGVDLLLRVVVVFASVEVETMREAATGVSTPNTLAVVASFFESIVGETVQ